MIYTPLSIKAMQLAYKWHHGQTDKVGAPYIHHPLAVAQSMQTEETTIAALLHDVMEDCGVTKDMLIAEGFPQNAVDAVVLLTKQWDEDYMEYLKRIRNHPVAREVKIADLKHNSIPERMLGRMTERDAERMDKYRKALRFLEE